MARCVQFVRQSVGTSPSSYCGRTDLLLFNGLQTKRFIGDTSSVAHRLHLKFSISSQPSELGNNRSRQHVWSLSCSWWCWACYNKYFCTHLGVTFFSRVRVAQHSGSFILTWKCLKKSVPMLKSRVTSTVETEYYMTNVWGEKTEGTVKVWDFDIFVSVIWSVESGKSSVTKKQMNGSQHAFSEIENIVN